MCMWLPSERSYSINSIVAYKRCHKDAATYFIHTELSMGEEEAGITIYLPLIKTAIKRKLLSCLYMKFHCKAPYAFVSIDLKKAVINGLYLLLMWRSHKYSYSLHVVLRNSAGIRNLAQFQLNFQQCVRKNFCCFEHLFWKRPTEKLCLWIFVYALRQWSFNEPACIY